MKRSIYYFFTLTLVLFSAPKLWAAEGPSFDCTKASSSVEKLICQNPELARLDRLLDKTYEQSVEAVKKFPTAKEDLKKLQAYERGWIKGRNECWKTSNPVHCIQNNYEQRISELQAQYRLVPHGKPVFYTCNDNPADEIVATFFQSERPSVTLERGDSVMVAILGPSGSGARYLGDFGKSFWIKGDEAMVEWPQGTSFNCRVRK